MTSMLVLAGLSLFFMAASIFFFKFDWYRHQETKNEPSLFERRWGYLVKVALGDICVMFALLCLYSTLYSKMDEDMRNFSQFIFLLLIPILLGIETVFFPNDNYTREKLPSV